MIVTNRRKHDSVASEIREFVHDEFEAHEQREAEMIAAKISEVLKAFPNGQDGIDDHHDYHLALMAAAKAQEEYWTLAKGELIKHGISAILTVAKGIAVLALAGLALKFGLGEAAVKVLGK